VKVSLISMRKFSIFIILFFLSHGVWSQGQQELKLATLAPEGSVWLSRFQVASDLITEQTEGRVSIRWYAGGVMGTEQQVLQKIRFGQLHGGMFTASGILERYAGLNNYTIPFLFRSEMEAEEVRENFDSDLILGLNDAGFTSYGLISGGYAYVMSTSAIQNLDDLSRRRIWTPEGDPIGFAALEALNLPPVILPLGDVLLGLQTGLVDVATSTPSGALILQWHTAIKYLVDLPVAYTIGSLLVDNQQVEHLSEGDQEIIFNQLHLASLELDQLAAQDNSEALEVLQSLGVEIITIDDAEIESWYQSVEDAMSSLSNRQDIEQTSLENILQFLGRQRNL